MPSVLDLISDSLSDVGALTPGQTPSGQRVAHAMRTQTDMLQSWSASRLRLNFVPEVSYPLTAGVGSYQIGPGAGAAPNFETGGANPTYTRPVYVQAVWYIVGTARRWPLNILTRPQFGSLTTRTLQDPDGPTDYFYDYNVPIATINVAPIPQFNGFLKQAQWNPLTTFAPGDEQQLIENYFPTEYILPMRLGLTIALAPAYRFSVTPEVTAQYQDAIQKLEQINNDKLSGAFGSSRTLAGPTKGDGTPVVPGQ